MQNYSANASYETIQVVNENTQARKERDLISYYNAMDEMEAFIEGNVEE